MSQNPESWSRTSFSVRILAKLSIHDEGQLSKVCLDNFCSLPNRSAIWNSTCQPASTFAYARELPFSHSWSPLIFRVCRNTIFDILLMHIACLVHHNNITIILNREMSEKCTTKERKTLRKNLNGQLWLAVCVSSEFFAAYIANCCTASVALMATFGIPLESGGMY